MSYTVINLTLKLVIQEIDNILVDYPKYPHQVAFSSDYLRNKLITYVLGYVPNRYELQAETQASAQNSNSKLLHLPSEHRLHVEWMIHKGIIHLLKTEADWIQRKIEIMKFLEKAEDHFLSMLERLGLAWWVEVQTKNPDCTYYFGPFVTVHQAQFLQRGYLEDITQEGAQISSVELKQCNPESVTVSHED